MKNNRFGAAPAAWMIFVLIILLGLSAYLWWNNVQLKNQRTSRENEMIELEKVQTELEHDYQIALESLEEYRSDNDELNDIIENQKKELNEQKEKINELIWNRRELGKARAEIKRMNSMTANYIAEIDKLKGENLRLSSSNRQLTEDKLALTAAISREKELNAQLEAAKSQLAMQSEKLDKSNKELSSKVSMAEAIKINFMEVQGYELKDNGERKKKSKAKDIDLLEVCLRTETNMVTKPGIQTIYLRFITPQGETIALENKGSGILTNNLDGSKVRYTTSASFVYENEDTNACLPWVTEYQLPKGVYDIELYHQGFPVGKGNFKLK